MSAEAKVGIFVFAGIVILVYMTLLLGGMRLGSEDFIEVSVTFPSAAGLDPHASVAVAGVEVGRVKKISLEDGRAKLILEINSSVNIGKDYTAMLKNRGLLGERYVELIPGAPDAVFLEEGDEIKRTATYTDMDKLVNILAEVATDIKGITGALKGSIGGEEGAGSVKLIVENLSELTSSINSLLAKNSTKFDNIMTNLDTLSEDMSSESPDILKGLKDVSDGLNMMIAENRDNLRDGLDNMMTASVLLQETMRGLKALTDDLATELSGTVNSVGNIADKIDRGEGTIGKLVNDPETVDRLNQTLTGINTFIEKAESFQTFIDYKGEYLFDSEETKSYISLKLQPKPDKYYLLQIVDSPVGKRETETIVTTVGGVSSEREVVTTTDDLLFSAQMAKKVGDLTVRGGLIESTGGFGLDYGFFNDKLVLSFDAFDFSKERNAHLKFGSILYFGKYFYLSAGYDDFVSRVGFESPYVGLGFHFEDEDIKYLLGSAPPMQF